MCHVQPAYVAPSIGVGGVYAEVVNAASGSFGVFIRDVGGNALINAPFRVLLYKL